MISAFQFIVPILRGGHRGLLRGVSLFAATCLLSVSLLAQNATPAGDNAGRRQRGGGQDNGGGRGNFDPAQMQDRMLNYLREQFGVTDDSEWSVIAERIGKVLELRRNAPAGGMGLAFAGRGGAGGGGAAGSDGGRGRGGRGGSVSPEQDALRAALVDKLPDAEIKARLARLREVRAQNAGKVEKAQEDLRAVLTPRQEAMAVMAGLLP
ncbi:MAG: hypothetical protein HY736_00380 [Verrucomicrobia bacterium]|nr:hypothetical protein [Verrucomicrobiota bacterium]